MKIPVWAVPFLLLAGFLLGRIDSGSEEKSQRASESALDRSSRSKERASRESGSFGGSAGSRLREEIRKSGPEAVPGLLKKALQHPDAFERRLLIMQCLDGMTASNWLEMYQQFFEVTQLTGIIHPTDQRMSLLVIGREGRQEAADWFFEQKKPDQLREVVWGWAQKDPQGALAWCQTGKIQDAELRSKLISVAVGGAAHLNGAAASEMLNRLSPEDRMTSVGDFTWNLVQRDGLEVTVEWAAQAQSRFANQEPEFVNRVRNSVESRIFETQGVDGGGEKAAELLMKLAKGDEIGTARLPVLASRFPESQRLDYLAALVRNSGGAQSLGSGPLRQQAELLARQNPRKSAEWCAANPNHPLTAVLAEALR